MKKSQIPSQMFTYIFILIVIGMLLFFGIRWLGSIMNKEEQISMAKVKVDMENSFEEIKYNYGSWSYEEFNIPSEARKVCFLDKGYSNNGGEGYYQNTDLCTSGTDDFDPLICDAWGAQDQNIVFDPIDAMGGMSIDVRDVEVDGGYICFNNTNGRIKAKLTGKGDAVKVSR